MHKLWTIIIWTLLLSSKIFSQTKEYKYLDKTINADINGNLIALIGTTPPGMTLIDNAFKPIKGKFTVYRFLATFQGWSFTNRKQEFHDILIVKTDAKNKIIIAYQYTLEWSEPPPMETCILALANTLTLKTTYLLPHSGLKHPGRMTSKTKS